MLIYQELLDNNNEHHTIHCKVNYTHAHSGSSSISLPASTTQGLDYTTYDSTDLYIAVNSIISLLSLWNCTVVMRVLHRSQFENDLHDDTTQ